VLKNWQYTKFKKQTIKIERKHYHAKNKAKGCFCLDVHQNGDL
jgi:hypothetical protein